MQADETVEVCNELAPFLKPFSLYSALTQHIAQKRLFLRRNLSYYAPERSAHYQTAEATHFITVHLKALQLAAAYNQGLVLYVAACRALWQNGSQVLVPLSAKAVLLAPGAAGSLPVRLPVTQPAGYKESLGDLVVLMLHAPAGGQGAMMPGLSAEHNLLSLLGNSTALLERGGKSISCDFERQSLFAWPQSGASVLHFTVQLQDPQQHEAAVELLQGVFLTHVPQPGSSLEWPSLSIARRQLSEEVRLGYRIEIRRAELPGTEGAAAAAGVAARGVGGPRPNGGVPWPAQQQQQQQGAQVNGVLPGQQQQQHAMAAQPNGVLPEQQRQQYQNGIDAPRLNLQQQGRIAGLKRKYAAMSRGPPPPQQERDQQRAVWVSLFSLDGVLQMEQQMEGYSCIVCNLRCRSFAALRQHLQASHDYFEYGFTEDSAEVEPEIAIRCRRELYDESGEFLPALELCNGDQNRQAMKPWQLDPFMHSLPPRLRHTRWLPDFVPKLRYFRMPGRQPQARISDRARTTLPQLHRAGSRGSDINLAEAAPQHSGLAGTPVASLVSQGSGVEEEEDEEHDVGSLEHLAAIRMGPRAARQRQPRKVRQRRQAKPTSVAQSKQGLALLTPDGRLKFYHSRSCVAMTQQELLADEDSDDDTDEAEWKRDCWQRLYEAGGQSAAAQRDFMFSWDLQLHRNPLYADGDVPRALQQFKQAQAAAGLADDPAFHRRFAVMVTNLWRYRLLTPDQAYELLQKQPPAQQQPQQQEQEQQPGAAAGIRAAALAGGVELGASLSQPAA